MEHKSNSRNAIMKEYHPQFDEKEKRTRTHWLIVTLFSSFFYPLFTSLFHTNVPVKESIFYMHEYFQFSFIATATLLPLWLLYHCAYKKQGTRLLTFWLIMSFLGTFLVAILVFRKPLGILEMIQNIMEAITSIYWCILSLKLRKINKKYQKQMASEEHLGSYDAT